MMGCRNTLISLTLKLICKILCFFTGMRSSRKYIDYDYSSFLGPNYKDTCVPPKYLSTFVSNHTSWLDVIVIISQFRPAFAAKKTLKKVPLFGVITQSLGCLFISRGASADQRNKIIEQI